LSLRRGSLRWAHASCCSSVAALFVLLGGDGLQRAAASGETRTISFHHIHTNEDLTVTYKVNGRYDEAALAKISHLLRDWREEDPIKMDPQLIDLLWEVHRETGAKESIWVVCGYRSPSTNSMLRRRSSGVAKFSQHMLGKAIDFYIPGVPLDQLRAAGLRAQRGGVGFYPSSGAPFVHMDTGSVRHWPRMPEEQLVAVLAKGQLASHSASDPRGTQLAQGEIQRKPKPFGLLARLFGGGKDEEEDAETASAQAKTAPAKATAPARAVASMTPSSTAASAKPAEPRSDKSAGEKVAAVPMPTPKPAKTETYKPETYQVASADSKAVAKLAVASAGSFGLASTTSKPVILAKDDSPSAKPAIVADDAATTKAARPAAAASLVAQAEVSANDIINQRGYWQGLPSTEQVEPRPARAAAVGAPRPTPTPKRAVATASADPATTASVTPWPLVKDGNNEPVPNALAYAAQPTPIAAARTVPMTPGSSAGTGSSRTTVATQGDTTVAVKRNEDRVAAAPSDAVAPPPAAPAKFKGANVVRVGDRFNDPWMRAMIVSPSAQSHMRTTVYGVQDYRNLGPYMQKPATTVAMTFADDPLFGMYTEKFAGGAVVFTPTVTFHKTAALK
jgi:uncharacterized protein YcbK (DUF882 family)